MGLFLNRASVPERLLAVLGFQQPPVHLHDFGGVPGSRCIQQDDFIICPHSFRPLSLRALLWIFHRVPREYACRNRRNFVSGGV